MLHLTKQERQVLLAAGCVAFLGMSLNFLFKTNPNFLSLASVLESDALYPKVDLNRAAYSELLNVPYIGPVTAQKIIDYRRENGDFSSVDEIQNIEGLHFKNYYRIIKYLTVKNK